MSKRAKLLTVSLALAGLLAVAFTGAALAHDPTNADDAYQDCWGEPGWGGHHGHEAICSETVSELLGLTHEEIHAQRDEGKSLVEIAAAQGVSEDALVEAIMAAKREIIQQRVEAGILTQEQADLMLEQMEQRTRWAVNQTTFADGMPCDYEQVGPGTGHGMMGHWDSQWSCHDETESGTGMGGMHGWGRYSH